MLVVKCTLLRWTYSNIIAERHLPVDLPLPVFPNGEDEPGVPLLAAAEIN